mgnify:CR=1 FL=1
MAVKSKLYSMTPKEIVAELDKYIIGQEDAKKSVAIALRNRYRRSLLSEEMREEITPKNILMMGPTGCGKTEIARRLAKLMDAPFVKVEATKFTEVGYVGRDVDSMVRDLVEASMRVTKQSKLEEKYSIAEEIAEEKIVEAIIPGKNKKKTGQGKNPFDFIMNSGGYPSQKQQYLDSQSSKDGTAPEENSVEMAREQVRQQLRQGLLEEQYIEIEVTDVPKGNQLDMSNEGMSIAIGNIFGDLIPPKTKKKNCKVKDARKILREQEAQKLIDMDQVTDEAIENAEQNGIIFIDEIDTSLHPALVKELVALYADAETNPHGSQLIFTTHDVSLINQSGSAKRLLAPDQIWLVEKNKEGVSELFPVTNLGIRHMENIGKNYLNGVYGAIPRPDFHTAFAQIVNVVDA